jgi:polar amino acid transport system substrate-binding protein
MRALFRHTARIGAAIGIRLPVVACALLCLLLAVPALARGPYRIGYTPGALISKMARDRVAVVYERAGLPVEFVSLPTKRSLSLAAEGSLDGEAGRIAGLEKHYPSLVRVDVSLMDFQGAAYVLGRRGIGPFRDTLLDQLRTGSLGGVIWAEKVMKGRRLERVKTYEVLFNMLLEGRIDLALSSRVSAEKVLRGAPERYRRIRQLEPLVYTAPFYHYLHKKNAAIVPALEKALRELRAEDYWRDGD